MSFTRIQIKKDHNISAILEDDHTLYIPRNESKDYVELLKRTWPRTHISQRNVA